MAPMITAGLTMQCKPNYRDENNFFYVFNGERAETKKIGAVPRDLALQP